MSAKLVGQVGSGAQFTVAAGQVVRKLLVDARIEGGDPEAQSMVVSVYYPTRIPGATLEANLASSYANIVFGAGGAGMQAAAIDIGHGFVTNIHGSNVQVFAEVRAAAAGPVDIMIGASVALGSVSNPTPLYQSAPPVLLVAGATTTIETFVPFARIARVAPLDNRVADLFIEGLNAAGNAVYGVRQAPGDQPAEYPLLSYPRSLRITNLGPDTYINLMYGIEL